MRPRCCVAWERVAGHGGVHVPRNSTLAAVGAAHIHIVRASLWQVSVARQNVTPLAVQISDGAIALVVAAGVGNERVVELLLQHGADATVPRDTDVYTVVA